MSSEVHEPPAKYLISANVQQIEIGLVPNGWELRALSQCGELKNGINKAAEDFGHGHPFVNLIDVFGKPRLTTQLDELGLLKTTAEERKNYDLRVGDVLFVRSSVKPSGVGLTTLVSTDAPNAVYSGFLIRFRANGTLDPAFLEHCFYSGGFRERLIASSTVSANTNINQSALKELKLAFPTCLGEQRAIATALSDVDALVAGLERLIAKKRDIKQATMQQLLTGQTRLPGFGGAWTSAILADLAKIEKGQLITTNLLVPGDVPVIAGGKRPAYFHATANRKGKTISISASGASAGYVAFHKGPIFASDCSTLSEAKEYSIEFLFYSLLNRQSEIYGLQTGGAQPHVQPKDLAPLVISIPPNVDEQTAIAAVLSDMDAELSALEARLTKTLVIKQGMMQELLTGKTRLV
jgi:type I restriction enzyme, S subunit